MCLPQHWLARVIGLLWLFAGVVFVALYTAELTATLTVQHLRSAIGVHDDGVFLKAYVGFQAPLPLLLLFYPTLLNPFFTLYQLLTRIRKVFRPDQ